MPDYSTFAEREREGWRNAAVVDAYVAKFSPITDAVARALVARAAPDGKTVLDLCCGQGFLTGLLVGSGARVVGLDFSPGMLSRARAAAPGAELHEGDAAAMPFADGAFDAVLCNFGMMHIPDQPAALAEIRRVLRPEGRFLMATWAAPDTSPAFATVLSAIRANADLSVAPAQPDLFAFARREQAEAMMREAGLELVGIETLTPAWELSEPSELFDIFLRATVATSQLIRGQMAEVVATIRDQITATVASDFASSDGYRVPVGVVVLTARAT